MLEEKLKSMELQLKNVSSQEMIIDLLVQLLVLVHTSRFILLLHYCYIDMVMINVFLFFQETQQRVALEEKVTRLEEENEKLSVLRSKAVVQLQSFSEKFFAMPEPKYISPVSTPPLQSPRLQSPRHSHMELRRFGSNTSVVSRLSGQNFNIKARYSNISL